MSEVSKTVLCDHRHPATGEKFTSSHLWWKEGTPKSERPDDYCDGPHAESTPTPSQYEAFTDVFLAGAAFWEHHETGFKLNEQERAIVIEEAERRIAEAKKIG